MAIEIRAFVVDLILVVDMVVLILVEMTPQIIDMNVTLMGVVAEVEDEEEENHMVEDLVEVEYMKEKEDPLVMKKVKITKKDTKVVVVVIMIGILMKEEVARDEEEMNGTKKRTITLEEEIVGIVVAKVILHLEKVVVVVVDLEEAIEEGSSVVQGVDLIGIQIGDLKEAVIEVVLVVAVLVVIVADQVEVVVIVAVTVVV